MSKRLIVSPAILTDKEKYSLAFYSFDLKAVQDIINDVKVGYNLQHHATWNSVSTIVEMTFASEEGFNAACMALLLYYQPLNNA